MPIKFEHQYGTKVVTHLSFGFGDVEIRTSQFERNLVFLNQSTAKEISDPIEDLDPGIEVSSDEIPGDSVLITFDNVRSLDVLIETLKRVKKQMGPNWGLPAIRPNLDHF